MSRRTTRRATVLDEVRAIRPADDSGWARSEAGRAVMARAMTLAPVDEGRPGTGTTRRRKQRSMLVGSSVAAALAVGGTAAAVALFEPDSPTQAGCWSALSVDADTTEASPGDVAELGAAEACRRAWTDTGEDVDTGNLVTCVNEHGGRGVFPAPGGMIEPAACASLGWQPDRG